MQIINTHTTNMHVCIACNIEWVAHVQHESCMGDLQHECTCNYNMDALALHLGDLQHECCVHMSSYMGVLQHECTCTALALHLHCNMDATLDGIRVITQNVA